ncbi:MAG TPA: YtxH domain-containing protein [Candidatus Saccharimonadales bacterium]|jgi:gas vesicle protein|nr:YtxH domain-containing protein [Candidatus Saccharimonadales bacterium]
MSDERSNGIGWFLAGLGLGTLVVVLYAPRSGRETREAIATGVDDGRKYLASLGQNAREQVNDWVVSGKRAVIDKKRQVEAGIDAVREAIRNKPAEKSS